ncbi:MAG: gliding motility-associated C-terminal domain-containing protein [Bacteroidota bacterium]
MRKSKGNFFIFWLFTFLIFSPNTISAQPGCPSINAGNDQTLNCFTSCATLNATVLQTGASTAYTVSSVPYAPPYPYSSGTQIMANIDDTWSTVITLPFNFCFFGNVYNKIVVGSNGLITFDQTVAGGYCAWSYSASCPSASLQKNSIFGPYHDIDPSVTGALYYGIQGVAPCRTFVISFYNVALFSCTSLKATHQIVLYENTNVIEVYIQNKPSCPGWNSGNTLVGIQNSTGTVGYVAPGRNTSAWTTTNEAWRFTPSGAPNYSVAWFNGATQVGTGLSISVCPTTPTTYTGKVTYTNCDAAQVVVQDQVFVNIVNNFNLTASASTPTFCQGQSTNINASGATSYTWYPTTGLSASTGSTVVATPSVTTTYNVIGTSGACVDTVSVTITVNPGPILTIDNPNNLICGGESSVISVIGATNYSWSPSSSLSSSGGSSVTATPSATTTYTVTGTTASCSGTASTTITVKPNPLLAVTPMSAAICPGETASFTASGATTYDWSPATGLNPTSGANVIASPSVSTTYTVTGTLDGCTSTASVNVTLKSKPSIAISPSSVQICQGVITPLTASGATNYSWTPPIALSTSIGATTSASPSFTTTYTSHGTTNGCTDSASVVVTVINNPIIQVTPSTASICIGENTNLVASGATNYTWSPSTGLSGTTGSDVTANPSATSTYSIIGVTNGCSDTTTVNITIKPKPIMSITPISAQICFGASTPLSASGATDYTWTPTTALSPTTGSAITASPTTTTTYTVHGTTNGCTDSIAAVVTVISNPAPQITPSTISICIGEQATLNASGGIDYTWSPAATLSSSSGNSVVATPTTPTTYTVTATSTGCSGFDTATVTVKPQPQLSVSPLNPTICYNNNIALTAAGADTYTWSPTSSLSSGSGNPVTASPLACCSYILVGTLNGCKDSIQIPFTVNPLPTISISAFPREGCAPLPVSFSANSTPAPQNYSWNFGNGVTSILETPNTVYFLSGQYPVSLSITDINGCSNSITEQNFITVHPKPVIGFTTSFEVGYIGQEITFNSTYTNSNSQWIWDFGDGTTITEQDPIAQHTFWSSQIFNVTHYVISEFGCMDTISKSYTVITKIVIPNVFTPNNDGMNDTFTVDGLQYIDGAILKIYNRWGRVIYTDENYKNTWNGNEAADGIYFYILTLPEFIKAGPFNGSVTIIR